MEVTLEVPQKGGAEGGSTAIYGLYVKGVVFKQFSLKYGIEISEFGC